MQLPNCSVRKYKGPSDVSIVQGRCTSTVVLGRVVRVVFVAGLTVRQCSCRAEEAALVCARIILCLVIDVTCGGYQNHAFFFAVAVMATLVL